MKSNYKAMVLSCIDPRFQPIVYNYLKKKKLIGKYSSFTIAGSAIGVTANKYKNWHKTFWENLSTSVKLHNIKKLIVINHRDCGVAKIMNGKKKFSDINEEKVHKNSFQKIKKVFKKKYPKLSIELKIISLNSKVETFK
tara:strand:- start:82 stop:498 length:417 start_codon:yes stop_codon:yes gene_type:complete